MRQRWYRLHMMSQSMRNITYVTNADMIWELMIGMY